jgi:histidinol-phosphate aminotransferase
MAYGSKEIVEILNRVKPPYNVSQVTQELALQALQEVGQVNDMIKELVQMRVALKGVFEKIPFVRKVYPSDANFLLVKVDDAKAIYQYLLSRGIVVRDRSNVQLCDNCLRITVGTEDENTELVEAMADWFVQSKKVQV